MYVSNILLLLLFTIYILYTLETSCCHLYNNTLPYYLTYGLNDTYIHIYVACNNKVIAFETSIRDGVVMIMKRTNILEKQ